MAFNFGDKPFKHSLPDGYLPIISASKEAVAINSNGGSGTGDGIVKRKCHLSKTRVWV